MTRGTGLVEVADGTWAWVAERSGWGWSNAGLVEDGGESLLVDTLFDLRLTAAMLDAMRAATPAATSIATVVNTHANGDHCYGNQLVADAEIVASTRSAAEMDEVPPALMAAFVAAGDGLGPGGAFAAERFGGFRFDDIDHVAPTTTFDGALELRVGERAVSLLELGPAHTGGDVVVHLPDAGVLFTGDLVFHGDHPVTWAGPVANWIDACDRMLLLGASVVVPGHGALGDRACIEDQRGYFEWLTLEGTPRLQGGQSPLDAARDLLAEGGAYAGWGEPERLAVNLTALARDLGHAPATDAVSLFALMAELAT